MTQYLKSGLKLIGGKTKIRGRLYSLFPTDYDAYFEPFGGTFNVLVGNDKFLIYEQGNDLNYCAVNYMNQIKNSPEAMWSRIEELLPQIKNNDDFDFYEFRDNEPSDPLENAVWFYFVTKLSMNGIYRRNKSGKCNSSFCHTTKGRGFFDKDWLFRVHERIKRTHFTCQDFRDTLCEAGAMGRFVDTFVFIDPPYRNVKTTYNGITFKDQDFVDLYELVNRASYKWMLTINDDPFIRDLFKTFNFIEHDVHYSCSQTSAGRGKAAELIITNY